MSHDNSEKIPSQKHEAEVAVSYRELTATFTKIGLLSFGGPAGQIALMHRIIVDEKKWFDEPRYLSALNFCMLLPGPEAHQLATYVGYRLKGFLGGLISGLLFLLPGLFIMLGIVIFYIYGRQLAGYEVFFAGIRAAVLAIILQAILRLASRSLKNSKARLLAVFSFLAIAVFGLPFPILILIAAVAGYLLLKEEKVMPAPTTEKGHLRKAFQASGKRLGLGLAVWLLPLFLILPLTYPESVLREVAFFFSTLSLVSFGGAYAALTYLTQAGVESYMWISLPQMIDGLGLAETTPGPLVLVTQFVAFLAGYQGTGISPLTQGFAAFFISAWALYVPSFIWIFSFAPHMDLLHASQKLSAILKGVSAAVVGVIASLGWYFGMNTLFPQVEMVSVFGLFEMSVPALYDFRVVNAILALFAGILVFGFKLGIVKVLALSVLAAFFVDWLGFWVW